ncbi:hypothetical protein GWI33_005712 [Rhynchophorus ferrugineus]|uniref:Uncharacterized protein n=1 Tax=Rhynchophorus ferrugineus TaxID=354439 RepID=A0A834IMU8_RHYFE|nr:hypothetical protein GWI33_005712 [Rhynchophorus ferrugineus]
MGHLSRGRFVNRCRRPGKKVNRRTGPTSVGAGGPSTGALGRSGGAINYFYRRGIRFVRERVRRIETRRVTGKEMVSREERWAGRRGLGDGKGRGYLFRNKFGVVLLFVFTILRVSKCESKGVNITV